MKLASLSSACLALGLAAAAVGCRANHLGADTAGHTYRAPLAAQRSGDDTVLPPALSAEDAKQVITVHQTGKACGTTGTSPAMPASTSSTSLSSPSGGAWPGASGNITLEAK